MARCDASDPREPEEPAEDVPTSDEVEQRMSALRARIASGEYTVDPTELARRILRSEDLGRPLRLVVPHDDEDAGEDAADAAADGASDETEGGATGDGA